MKIIFSQQIIEKHLRVNIIKIWLLGGELLHADGQMDTQIDTMRCTDTFHNFMNMPKN